MVNWPGVSRLKNLGGGEGGWLLSLDEEVLGVLGGDELRGHVEEVD